MGSRRKPGINDDLAILILALVLWLAIWVPALIWIYVR